MVDEEREREGGKDVREKKDMRQKGCEDVRESKCERAMRM